MEKPTFLNPEEISIKIWNSYDRMLLLEKIRRFFGVDFIFRSEDLIVNERTGTYIIGWTELDDRGREIEWFIDTKEGREFYINDKFIKIESLKK